MPYIPGYDRPKIDAAIDVEALKKCNAGGIAYALTLIFKAWAGFESPFGTKALLVGTVVCALLEYVRRVLFPYEDKKREENGDAY